MAAGTDRIRGRTAVITGAARGIGLATATALLERGATVVIGDRDAPALRSALAGFGPGAVITGHPVDVTDPESMAAFFDAARADGGGRIDILVNNAGVMPVGAYLDQSEQLTRTAVDVNLLGVLTGCRLVLPEMVARRSGHIVNIASLAGAVPVPGQVVYAATKFAVIGLTCSMADEFAPYGVEVSAILPPFTATELIAGTQSVGGSKPVAPQRIAAAVVGVLDRPRTQVMVPAGMRVMAPILGLLGARTRRWVHARMGSDRMFLDFDVAARRSYQQRVETATGLVQADPVEEVENHHG
ncbi:MAG: SDR family oxidoreductase [Mycolicibacterium sp.]|uniref:Short-chain dehydrogenase n=1 Tax=Mycolicibacterium insubricum TaxID=444597 RepID=A0A1X0DFR4_9MYCO|nr:SDR family oxidoreductase [Mycolicibacterium insubricum]MCB9438791.1 SDR family oxidoreductase [Mycolicibacterium sp.]MCV7080936.1 SDR family oxidoreductase [Mycolicibacterium insubricum]ORA71231.1 short-chain dehydrogenase [Mycolicibacterium insubricum]